MQDVLRETAAALQDHNPNHSRSPPTLTLGPPTLTLGPPTITLTLTLTLTQP